jgi:hypothetical protein
MNWLRKRLVDDWRDFTRWWSVRMTAVGALLGGILAIMPSMPQEVQAAVPERYRIAAVAIWALASLYSRVAKQKSGG